MALVGVTAVSRSATGRTPTLSRTYVPAPASITVTLSPASAQWRVDSGVWMSSGSTVADLAPGAHTIEFSSIASYATSAAQTLTLANGEQRIVSVTYSATASISVTSDPSWLAAQWRVNGGEWRAAGTSVNDLPVGAPHTIDFSTVSGYVTPPSQTFTLAAGEWRSITGTYVRLAAVSVTSDPNWISAQWRIDNGPWRDFGTIADNLSFDIPHTVDFSPVSGGVAPPSQTFTLSAGEQRSIVGTYLAFASVNVSADPFWISAQWRIDNGP